MIFNKDSNLLQFKNLVKETELTHFCTTIKGGVSTGNYKSFNLGAYSGDEPENFIKNKKILTSLLNIDPEKFYLPHQVHQNKICTINENFLSLTKELQIQKLQGTDAIITNQKNIGIGVITADCVPILLYDTVNKVLAAIHAGWKGTVANIAGNTMQVMKKEFNSLPENIIAGIGPSICLDCFEVGEEVTEAFIQAGFSIKDIGYQHNKTLKYHIDLKKANKLLLNHFGILSKNIETTNYCTFTNPELFFSARRQTIQSGRMITGGILK